MSNFITRIHKYSCKHLSNGRARIFIQNSKLLIDAGMPVGTSIETTYSKNRIEVRVVDDGTNTIMDTGRGALLELRNKKTHKSFEGYDNVVITVRKGFIVITLPASIQNVKPCIGRFFDKISNGQPVSYASLFSGVGWLTYFIQSGLSESGVHTEMSFANDSDELTLACNVEGNPVWERASKGAIASSVDLNDLDLNTLEECDIVEVSYPCVNTTKLCEAEYRDLNHPVMGHIFVPLVAALKKMNPCIIIFECSGPFLNSQTYDLIKRSLNNSYRFESTLLKGHPFGDFEDRERSCVVAVPHEFPPLELEKILPSENVVHRELKDIYEKIESDSPLWKKMEHVKNKVSDERLNFKNNVYHGCDTKIATIIASYASPKIGAPMIGHETDDQLQRQITNLEHIRIRRAPRKLSEVLMNVSTGIHPLVSRKGNKSAVHRMCGNGVAPLPWVATGNWLGKKIMSFFKQWKALSYAA
ncbi:hypothetical protein A1QO_06250 [Vibrio genomosp. F10 str. ZF-129]|uniref:Uncharacterized protein n=1 Tax=Vibrio genomosp. F10 str. ZF-129 TaxID=1187848 RepID=A0A1E5BH32_9VIBR|nr:DNA cytosine methyltransferase [Vibrio genomosp. F10]OEE34983.1 hypothetical protein A1QO_06250 [Vibrio genomosp. F10 str. ZF-129]